MNCYYTPGSTSIIDTINDATGLTTIYGETLEQIRLEYPAAEVWDFDAAVEQIMKLKREKYVTKPKLIDSDRWGEMLEVLPPMLWRSGSGSESFMICEATTADLHAIYCRIGQQYFEFTDSKYLSHQEIVQACLDSLAVAAE
jgi:hypothetical protein